MAIGVVVGSTLLKGLKYQRQVWINDFKLGIKAVSPISICGEGRREIKIELLMGFHYARHRLLTMGVKIPSNVNVKK